MKVQIQNITLKGEQVIVDRFAVDGPFVFDRPLECYGDNTREVVGIASSIVADILWTIIEDGLRQIGIVMPER